MRSQPIKLGGPKRQQPQQADQNLLPATCERKPPFLLVHYPTDWYWRRAYGLLPNTKEIGLKPGANGTRSVRPNAIAASVPLSGRAPTVARMFPRMDATALEAGILAKGGVLVPGSDPRLGEFDGWDGCFYDVEGGGRCFVMPWETPTIVRGQVRWNDSDSERIHKFRQQLRDSGIVPQIAYPVVLDLIDRREQRIIGIQERAGAAVGSEFIQTKIASIEGEIAGIRESWAALTEQEEGVRLSSPKKADKHELPVTDGEMGKE